MNEECRRGDTNCTNWHEWRDRYPDSHEVDWVWLQRFSLQRLGSCGDTSLAIRLSQQRPARARRIYGTMNVSVTIKLTVPAVAKHVQQVREAAAGLSDSSSSVEVVRLPDEPRSLQVRFTVPDARQEDVVDRIGRQFWNVEDYSTSAIGFGPRRRRSKRSEH